MSYHLIPQLSTTTMAYKTYYYRPISAGAPILSRNLDGGLVENAVGLEVSGASARKKRNCRKNQPEVPELEATTPETPEMMTFRSLAWSVASRWTGQIRGKQARNNVGVDIPRKSRDDILGVRTKMRLDAVAHVKDGKNRGRARTRC